MKILITGAAGFLGAETVRLATAAGHEVRAMIRPASPRARVPLPDEHIYWADMTDEDRLPGAVEGMDAVIHCAAVTSEGGTDPELSRRVNVEGTERLFRAASAAGVSRWIQISSMSAHPGSTSVYGRTKLAADDYLRRAVKGPAWTILRPSLIYGPGDRGLVAKTLGLLEKLPFLPMVGSGEELLRPILVSDVARAALTCLERPDLAGRTYMIGGADEVSLNDFMKRLLAGRGMRRPLVHLPIPVCMILARLLTLAVKSPPLTVDNVLGVLQAQRVDTRFARRDWAFDPAGLERGLDLTFAPENR